jgi:DNA-binding LytR/AlgR family response regulator
MTRLNVPDHPEIAYLQADINYTVFHLSDGSKVISSTTHKKHESVYRQFDFLRINKSYLLNPSFIASVRPKGNVYEVLLMNGVALQSSRRKAKILSGMI